MAKTKPSRKKTKGPVESVEGLLTDASALLQTSQLEEARLLVVRALAVNSPTSTLPARSLLGEICIELGEPEEARANFLAAAELDSDGLVPESQG
ncbi:MAG: hypothetical protein LQ350_008553, partial [Teloschistes chrysophthalmus]